MNKQLFLILCLLFLFFSCKRATDSSVVPLAVNPKRVTYEMDRLFSWKTIVRHHCLPCTPSYDSSFSGGQASFSIGVLNDSTVYIGIIAYNQLTEDDLFHYVRHEEKEKYTYFMCPTLPYVKNSLKYYYDEHRVELLLQSDSLGFGGVDVLYISQ